MSFNVYGLGGLINKSIKIKIINDKQPQMEQHAFKNVSNSLNANIYSYLETTGGKSSNLYLNVVHFFNSSVN
jgi:hypothetical protein